jgi:hypothetical protein
MPVTDPPPITPKEESKWRAEFERMGRRHVLAQHQNFHPRNKSKLAVKWLREGEKTEEFRRRWSFEISVASIGISILALIVGVIALVK